MRGRWNIVRVALIGVAITAFIFLIKYYIYSNKEYSTALDLAKTNQSVVREFGEIISVNGNEIAEVSRVESQGESFRIYSFGFELVGAKSSGEILIKIWEGSIQWKIQIYKSENGQEMLLYEEIKNETPNS